VAVVVVLLDHLTVDMVAAVEAEEVSPISLDLQ
jgi:hypothetical protein